MLSQRNDTSRHWEINVEEILYSYVPYYIIGVISIARQFYTPGGRTGKVLASHAEDEGSRPVKAAPIYMYCVQVVLGGYCPIKGGG